MDRETNIAEHPQGHFRGILWSNSIPMDVKHGKVSRGSALAENAVGGFHQAIEREAAFGETAKRCMQMAHQHRRSNALAGNISQHKEQATICFEEIAVITADHAGGLIVVSHFPTI